MFSFLNSSYTQSFTQRKPLHRFGRALADIPSEEFITTKNGLQVPQIFYNLLRALEHAGGLQTPGIFRLNGSNRKSTLAKVIVLWAKKGKGGKRMKRKEKRERV